MEPATSTSYGKPIGRPHSPHNVNTLWLPRCCERDRQAAYQPCRVPVALRFDEYRTARSPAPASQTTARSPASAVRARGRSHGESEVRFAHGLSLAVTWRRFFPDARRTGIAWRTAACPGNPPRRGTRSAENVTCLEIGEEAGDGLVDDSRRDHEPDRSGLVQLLHEVLRRRRSDRLFLDQLFHRLRRHVENHALVVCLEKPSHHVGAHSAQSNHSELHGWLLSQSRGPFESCCSDAGFLSSR